MREEFFVSAALLTVALAFAADSAVTDSGPLIEIDVFVSAAFDVAATVGANDGLTSVLSACCDSLKPEPPIALKAIAAPNPRAEELCDNK